MTSSFSTGRIIAQTKTVYAWTGTADASSSTVAVNGAVQRTNLATNPAPRKATWVSSAGTPTVAMNALFSSGWAASIQAPDSGGFYILTGVFTAAGGVSYFAAIEGVLAAGGVARITVRFRNGAGAETYLSGPNQTVPAGALVRIANTVTAPSDAVDAVVFFDVQSGGNGGTASAGSAYFSTVEGSYFDGSTPGSTVLTYETVQPLVVTGYEASREVRNVFNPVLGAAATVAAAFPAGLRKGTLTAVFTNRADAMILDGALAGTMVVTFTDSDVPGVGMTFLPADSIRVYQAEEDSVLADGSTVTFWYVEFGYQEVTA